MIYVELTVKRLYFFGLVSQAVKAVARTVTLSAKASLVASAVTSGASFDLRSIKPGMLVDATVKSLLPNGMLVREKHADRPKMFFCGFLSRQHFCNLILCWKMYDYLAW